MEELVKMQRLVPLDLRAARARRVGGRVDVDRLELAEVKPGQDGDGGGDGEDVGGAPPQGAATEDDRPGGGARDDHGENGSGCVDGSDGHEAQERASLP